MASSQELNNSNGQDFSASLLILANYSNFYSVITVLVCFIITVVFILRLNGDHIAFSSSVVVKHVIPEQRMVGTRNPFSLQMDTTKSSSLISGLHCLVSSLAASSLYSYWGVNIQALYHEFQLPWQQLRDRILADDFLTGSYVYKAKSLQLDHCSEKQLHFPTPQEMTDVVMTANSRTVYPVVLLNISLSATPPTNGAVQVVAMLSAIHLKDAACSMNSYIINQHLKTYNNQIFNLQPIFMASLPDNESSLGTPTQVPSPSDSRGQLSHRHSTEAVNITAQAHKPPMTNITDVVASSSEEDFGSTTNVKTSKSSSVYDENDDPPSADDGNTENFEGSAQNDCIVCQCETISMALLPCRHACVCRTCFSKLERCPLCREYIHSYFLLEDSSRYCTSSAATSMSPNSVPYTAAGQMHRPTPHIPMQRRRTLKQWLIHLNDTVNEYLGFW